MEYGIYYQGGLLGTLTLEREGLYYRLSAQSEEPGAGVWRLWACFGTESRLVGVCFPQTGGLHLEKRISRHSWPILPDCFVLGREQEGFRPWRGILEGVEVPDAMLREEGANGQTLAVFAPPEGAVPLAEYIGLMREGRLDGRPCLLLALPDGLPELPEEEALAAETPEESIADETPQNAAGSDEAAQEEAASADVPPESDSGADGEAGSERQV